MIGCYNVIEQDQKILMVREKTKTGFHWALPAGKLELNETVIECAIREASEETGLRVKPEFIVGIYQTPLLSGNNVVNNHGLSKWGAFALRADYCPPS